MSGLKSCPFCVAPVNITPRGNLMAWHRADCFFQLLDESNEVDMTEEELRAAFIAAWNRRANDG